MQENIQYCGLDDQEYAALEAFVGNDTNNPWYGLLHAFLTTNVTYTYNNMTFHLAPATALAGLDPEALGRDNDIYMDYFYLLSRQLIADVN